MMSVFTRLGVCLPKRVSWLQDPVPPTFEKMPAVMEESAVGPGAGHLGFRVRGLGLGV